KGSLQQVAGIDLRPTISFPGESQHRIRPRLDPAVNQTCEVDAQERKLRVGHRIDEVADEELPLGTNFVIFAAKGNDFGRWPPPRSADQPIRVKPAAGDDKFGAEIADGGLGAP